MLRTNASLVGDGLTADLTRKAKALAEARAIEMRQNASEEYLAWYEPRSLWPLQGEV